MLFDIADASPVAATPIRPALVVPRTAGRTPAAIRLKYLTKQLSQHRDRIVELQSRNDQLELLCSRLSGENVTADRQTGGSVAGTHISSSKVMRLQTDLSIALANVSELRTRIEALEDENIRLRATRRHNSSTAAASTTPVSADQKRVIPSPLTPSDEFNQLLLSIKVQAAEMAQAAALRASAELSASRSTAKDASAKVGPATVPPRTFSVLPLVREAADHCRKNE